MNTASNMGPQRKCDQLILGHKRPLLALTAFLASFAFASIPFVVDSDYWAVVVPCFVACFCSSLLFLRLLIGALGIQPLHLVVFLGILACFAGQYWYVVVVLALATLAGDFLVQRAVGKFVPLLNVNVETPGGALRS